jgi:uncharacterized protein
MRWLAGVVASIAVALAVSAGAAALDVPKAPTLDVPIVDQTGTLTAGQIQQLADTIATSRKEKSYQIGILIIPTLGNDEYLEGYSLKVAREWGIGEKDTSNGVLLLIAKDDRKLRIEVGRGLEGDLTDVRANRIIRNVITPKFKEGKYFEGISDGVNSIQLAVAAKPDPAAAKTTESVDWGAIVSTAVFIGIAVLSWLGAVLGRSKSWWAGGVIGAVAGLVLMLIFGFAIWAIIGFVGLIFGGLGFDYLVSKNYKAHARDHTSPAWWAGGTWGGGGGWGGGSSGGGFGGGGFSGGGSSGSW